MQVFRFIITSAAVIGVLSVTSILWPGFSDQPRPEPLATIYDRLSRTQQGNDLERILGVSDENQNKSGNIQTMVYTGVDRMVTGIRDAARHMMISRLYESFLAQYEKLPDEDKKYIRSRICAPEKQTPDNN